MTKVFNPIDFRLLRKPAARYSNKMPERTALPRSECPLITEAHSAYATHLGANIGAGCYRSLAHIHETENLWN